MFFFSHEEKFTERLKVVRCGYRGERSAGPFWIRSAGYPGLTSGVIAFKFFARTPLLFIYFAPGVQQLLSTPMGVIKVNPLVLQDGDPHKFMSRHMYQSHSPVFQATILMAVKRTQIWSCRGKTSHSPFWDRLFPVTAKKANSRS